jgi:hypothetical protein
VKRKLARPDGISARRHDTVQLSTERPEDGRADNRGCDLGNLLEQRHARFASLQAMRNALPKNCSPSNSPRPP